MGGGEWAATPGHSRQSQLRFHSFPFKAATPPALCLLKPISWKQVWVVLRDHFSLFFKGAYILFSFPLLPKNVKK